METLTESIAYLIAFMNLTCDACIDFMKIMTYTWGATYGVLNALLFVILGPLSVICGFVATILSYINKTKISKGFLIAGIVMTSIIIFMILLTFMDISFPHLGLTDEMIKDAAHLTGYEGTSLLDKLCYVTIDFLIAMSRQLYIPYGTLNVILYVIIGPISTLCFFASAILSYSNRKVMSTMSKIFFSIGSFMIGIAMLMILITLICIIFF